MPLSNDQDQTRRANVNARVLLAGRLSAAFAAAEITQTIRRQRVSCQCLRFNPVKVDLLFDRAHDRQNRPSL